MQAISWYLNRLSLMSPGEIVWRFKGAIVDRIEAHLPYGSAPLANTANTKLVSWSAPSLEDAQSYIQAADRILQGQVDLFGKWTAVGNPEIAWNVEPTRGIRLPMHHGKSIDYRDPDLVGSARDVWELNRQYQLVAIAQAWALSGEQRYKQCARDQIASWLRDSPYPMGLNWVSALESGIRLINWYLAARLLRFDREDLASVTGWQESIFRHCQFIWANQSRYSSANNHLIGEMAGLYIATCAWPLWPTSVRWRTNAKLILEREARRQVHLDGVTKEQTVGYQVFVLQFLMIAGLAGETCGDPFSSEYWSIVRRMIQFLRTIADRSGHLPDFGDSDDGMAFMLSAEARSRRLEDLIDLDRILADREWKPSNPLSAATWLITGFTFPATPAQVPQPNRRDFTDGGYFVLGDRFGSAEEASLVFDAAPLGYLSIAAHGHADCLSFTLSLGGDQILIDPGTYCYHSDSAWRNYFRSTAAHNTLRIDGYDQSEMGGPFMWLRKAQPHIDSYELEGSRQRIRARHDGYSRMKDPVTHIREVILDVGASTVDVLDVLACGASHQAERFWHLAEDCTVQAIDNNTVLVRSRNAEVTIQWSNGSTYDLIRGSEAPPLGWVSRQFGVRVPTTTIVVRNAVNGPAELRTSLRWTRR